MARYVDALLLAQTHKRADLSGRDAGTLMKPPANTPMRFVPQALRGFRHPAQFFDALPEEGQIRAGFFHTIICHGGDSAIKNSECKRPIIANLPVAPQVPFPAMSATRKAFSARLREAMLDEGHVARRGAASGVDVQSLKVVAGVTAEMARRYTIGEALPDPDRMVKIADWLGVRLPWLRDGTEPRRGADPQSLSDDEQKLLRCYRMCSAKGRNFVLKAAESASQSMRAAKQSSQ